MFEKLFKLIKYNRDWVYYIWSKYWIKNPEKLLTFRLRNNQVVTLKSEVRFLLNEIFLNRVYDVPGFDMSNCQSILDLGANVGVFALHAADQAPKAKIHCFEPSSQNMDILKRNIKTNNVNAVPYNFAIAASSGTGYLSLSGSSAGYTLGEAGLATEQVECVDLLKAFDLTGVKTFDFVKMDIEGPEREVLNQCSDELFSRMRVLVVEWHHSWAELEKLADLCRGKGFLAYTEILPDQTKFLKIQKPN